MFITSFGVRGNAGRQIFCQSAYKEIISQGVELPSNALQPDDPGIIICFTDRRKSCKLITKPAMPSLLPGYEYDIFISYRQNDNRTGWVTEFVTNLQEELGATIKEPISIYFDKNAHDGLLEFHDVHKSLEGKLRCVLFIPILSQTYCDPKSFAWQHEFCAFNELAKKDEFGRDIRLHNGNVVSRILPVKIHELDPEDKVMLEKEIGGTLRAIEFIYREPGVNRSLKPNDNKNENASRTDYRNQSNKIANACKEIIWALRNVEKYPVVFAPYATRQINNPVTRSIAVLPFVNMTDDPGQEYFSDGLTEEIIADLSRLSALHVISRTSAMVLKGSKKDVRTIGQELNVRYVLEGSVRKTGNKLRITAQLIDTTNDAHLWAEKFNGVLDEVFDIQEKVSRAIVDSLKLELTPQEQARLLEKSPVEPAALELYLGGRYHLNRTTPSELAKAIELFEGAISKDPRYALAYAGLANAYNYLGWLGGVAREVYPKAKQTAVTALEIDETLAEAHAVLGYAATFFDWDWATAERELERAITLNPNYAEGYLHYSWYLGSQLRLEESRAAIVRASELDPLSLVIHTNMANYYQWNRDYDRALAQTKRVLELAPNLPLALLFSGMAYWGKKQYDEAAHGFAKLVELAGPVFKGYLGYSQAKAGHIENAIATLEEMKALSRTEPMQAFQFALVMLGLERIEEAMSCLENAFEERACAWFPYIRQESLFDPLRGYPRFRDLVRRLNFQR
jgi:TolB-like protein/Flp pilus assembly protein TadD